jgi:hypothetical protein
MTRRERPQNCIYESIVVSRVQHFSRFCWRTSESQFEVGWLVRFFLFHRDIVSVRPGTGAVQYPDGSQQRFLTESFASPCVCFKDEDQTNRMNRI